MSGSVTNPDRIQSVAAIAQTFIGVVALVLSIFAIWFSINSQRENVELTIEAAARSDWSSYMNSAMDYPEFSLGFSAEDTLTNRKKYEWYVSNMLFRAETVLRSNYFTEWRSGIVRQIRYHKPYLCKPEMEDELLDYAEDLRELVASVCREKTDA